LSGYVTTSVTNDSSNNRECLQLIEMYGGRAGTRTPDLLRVKKAVTALNLHAQVAFVTCTPARAHARTPTRLIVTPEPQRNGRDPQMSGFLGRFVGFFVGKRTQPDISLVSGINSLDAVCRVCRVSGSRDPVSALRYGVTSPTCTRELHPKIASN
jgi:hypothetical protein